MKPPKKCNLQKNHSQNVNDKLNIIHLATYASNESADKFDFLHTLEDKIILHSFVSRIIAFITLFINALVSNGQNEKLVTVVFAFRSEKYVLKIGERYKN
jgi:hypothetical protein